MPHIESFFEKPHLAASDLNGADMVLTIAKAEPITVGAKKEKKGRIHFTEPVKAMVCNITNARTIAALYGGEADDLVGKRITLFPTTTTNLSGQIVPCIRIREQAPIDNGQMAPQPPNTDEMISGWSEALVYAASSEEVDRLLKQAELLQLPEVVMVAIRRAAEAQIEAAADNTDYNTGRKGCP